MSFGSSPGRRVRAPIRILMTGRQDEVGLRPHPTVSRPVRRARLPYLSLAEGALMSARPFQRRRPPYGARRARTAAVTDAAQVTAHLGRRPHPHVRECVCRTLCGLRLVGGDAGGRALRRQRLLWRAGLRVWLGIGRHLVYDTEVRHLMGSEMIFNYRNMNNCLNNLFI